MLFLMSCQKSRPSQLDKSALLGPKSSQVTNINREALPFICTHSLKKVCKVEKNKCTIKKREVVVWVLHCSGWVLYWGIFAGFSPLWFPRVKNCVLCVSVLVDISMILLVKKISWSLENISWSLKNHVKNISWSLKNHVKNISWSLHSQVQSHQGMTPS